MDWLGMLPELLAIIAQKHTVFYEDYYSFAGVSKSWHLAAIQAAKVHKFPNGPPSRFPSLMLAQKTKDKEFCELLLLSNKNIRKKSIRKIRLPQIYDKVFMTSCGWLVTVGKDFSSQLINPLSCETINLPKVNTFDPEYFLREDSWHGGIRKLILLTSNNQSTLVLLLVVVSWGWRSGKVYYIGIGNIIYAWDVHRKDQTAVKISMVPKNFYKGGVSVTYLIGVDDGERKRLLVLIREGRHGIRHGKATFKTKFFLVFAYDLEKRTWSKVKDLGTKALFVGDASFSIDQDDTTGVIKGNSIYFIDDTYFKHGLPNGNGRMRDMRIYHLSDETIKPYFNGVSLSRTVLAGNVLYFYTKFRSTFSQGDCFIPFDIKQSFSHLVNLLEVKQHVSASVKEIDNIQLGIVNQAELKLFSRILLHFLYYCIH
ncbi:hypothetical protein Tco_1170152 [Tanacetum coccineum]